MNIQSISRYSLFIPVLMCAFFANFSHAANCSPGIPCTDYNINTDTTAGTDPALNGPKTGQPAPYNTGSCDGNFMNQIYARSYLETQREIIMSEQLIHKPDSVLEYTCFNQYISKAAHEAGAIFSESQDFKNRNVTIETADNQTKTYTTINDGSGPSSGTEDQDDYSVFQSDRLDNRLGPLIFDSLKAYINGNFSHTFMGGATTIDNNLSYAIGANDYNCSHMKTIWDIAPCIDFGEDDKFRSFSDLTQSDPRALPQACSPNHIATDSNDTVDTTSAPSTMSITVTAPCPTSTTAPAGLKTNINVDIIRVANNCEYKYTDFDSLDLLYGKIKEPSSDADKIAIGYPADCSLSLPIPTGVPVITYTTNENSSNELTDLDRVAYVHYEHICPNPGCHYIPAKIPTSKDPTTGRLIIPAPSATIGVCRD